jgi:DNA polymerase-3 subunit beta
MKIYVEQSDLYYALEKAEKLLRKAKLPVLESVLLSAKNNKITVTANNTESAIIIDVYGNIEEPGEVLIDKSNFKLIKKLSNRLCITDLNDIINIKGNRELKFKQIDTDQFPIPKTEVNYEAFMIPENEFKDSLKIKTFAGTDENRITLCSLCINKNRIIAVDGFRLAKIDLNIDNQAHSNMLIPILAVKELKFEYYFDSVKKEINYLKITGDDWQYITRLIAGEYLNIDNVIPQEFKLNLTLPKDVLNDSVEFAKEILTDKIPVIFNIADSFKVTALGKDKEFNETIPSNVPNLQEQDYFKVGYNSQYLLDIFKTLQDDKINLNFSNTWNAPLIITGENKADEIYMVLPVRLAS